MAAFPNTVSWLKIWLPPARIIIAGLTILSRFRLRRLVDVGPEGRQAAPSSDPNFHLEPVSLPLRLAAYAACQGALAAYHKVTWPGLFQ